MGNKQATKAEPLQALQDETVDVNKMMGKWYVISSIPTPFEKGAHNATEVYEWTDTDDDSHSAGSGGTKTADSSTRHQQQQAAETETETTEEKGDDSPRVSPEGGEFTGRRFKVTFGFNKGSFEGKHKEMYQKGSVYSHNGAEWRVQPKLMGIYIPVKLPFLIIDKADDYSWVTIGYPSRQFLWILNRTPIMDSKIYDRVQGRAVELGYDESKINMVPQQPEHERNPQHAQQ